MITYFTLHSSGFNTKEKMFVTLAWIPKATVQVKGECAVNILTRNLLKVLYEILVL